MCITNNQSDQVLKQIREFEKQEITSFSSEKLAEFLAYAKSIEDCIKKYQDVVKIELSKRKEGEIFYFPEIEKKVYLQEGKSSTIYSPEKIYNSLKNKGFEDSFFEIINVVKTKVDSLNDEVISKIVEESSIPGGKGESIITIRNMNKKELVEHIK